MWDVDLTQLYRAVGGMKIGGRHSGREIWDIVSALTTKSGDIPPKQDSP